MQYMTYRGSTGGTSTDDDIDAFHSRSPKRATKATSFLSYEQSLKPSGSTNWLAKNTIAHYRFKASNYLMTSFGMQQTAKRRTIRLWIRMRRFVLHNVLHADDPPHPLALGIAIGLFVTFTPTVGLQMMIVVFLAWLLKANKVVGIPIVWISNPATFVPIYYPCYRLGRWLLGSPPMGRDWWDATFRHPPDRFFEAISFYWTRIWEIATPLTVGCLVASTFFGLIGYCLSYSVIYTYRMKRFGDITPPESYGSMPRSSD